MGRTTWGRRLVGRHWDLGVEGPVEPRTSGMASGANDVNTSG